LSNTGEGEAPVNAKKFVQVLKKKEDLDEIHIVDWTSVAFTVFGLGNTQYEFYNKTGIDVDALLETRGAHRAYKLGLGDNNASLEDDYVEWKNDLWEALALYRKEHLLEERA
jgi:NADPH-ferrihemoprotein reductase